MVLRECHRLAGLEEKSRAGCDMLSALFESSAERVTHLSEVGRVRTTANGKKKSRRNRGNSSDAEQVCHCFPSWTHSAYSLLTHSLTHSRTN